MKHKGCQMCGRSCGGALGPRSVVALEHRGRGVSRGGKRVDVRWQRSVGEH